MRVTVGTLVGLMASGHSNEAILEAYPYLEARICKKPFPTRPGALKKLRFLSESREDPD